MTINRAEMKRWSKKTMLTPRKPNIFLVTLVFVAVTYVLDLIVYNLTEYGEIYNTIYDGIIAGDFPEITGFSLSPQGILFYLAATVMGWVLAFGYRVYALGVSRGEEMSFWSLFEGFNHFIKCILLQILVGLATAIGTLFFIVPGIIISCMLSQSVYVLIDGPQKGVFRCMKESGAMMRGHKMEYLVLTISFFGWYLLMALPELVAYGFIISLLLSVWVTPYTELTFARYYNTITGQDMEPKGIEADDNSQ